MTDTIIASAASTSLLPTRVFAGDAEILTGSETIKGGQGVLLQYTPLGRGADGKLIPAVYAADNTAVKAQFVLAYDVDTTGGDINEDVYKGAYFNTNIIKWPASYDTDAKKAAAFDGTMILHRPIADATL